MHACVYTLISNHLSPGVLAVFSPVDRSGPTSSRELCCRSTFGPLEFELTGECAGVVKENQKGALNSLVQQKIGI